MDAVAATLAVDATSTAAAAAAAVAAATWIVARSLPAATCEHHLDG